jgi:dissimilatory sulfite reductase (desulfoviridin) alpha/beta subunit
MERLLVSQKEAAKLLSISERSLFTLRTSGRIKAVRIGMNGGWRYSIEELRRFIRASENEGSEKKDGVNIGRG